MPRILMLLVSLQAFAAPFAGTREGHLTRRIIYVVGLDTEGNSLAAPLPAVLYRNSVRHSFSAVNASLAPSLARRGSSPRTGWELRTISVGIGFGAQVGLGPLWNVSGAARLKLVFTNSRNPVYPD